MFERIRRFGLCFLLIFCLASSVRGDVVALDLLKGIGGFNKWALTQWSSTYRADDYNWNSPAILSLGGTNGNRWGVSSATNDDSVALGWSRDSGPNVNPATNTVYRVSTAAGGARYQYLALKGGQSADWYFAGLRTEIPVKPDAYILAPHPRDEVTFKVDYLRMEDFSGFTGAAHRLTYSLHISWQGKDKSVEIPASTSPVSGQVSTVIPSSGVSGIRAEIYVNLKGPLGAGQPALYVGGAHLYVKRRGTSSAATIAVPVPRNRRIKTMISYAQINDAEAADAYRIASNYDLIMLPNDSFAGYVGLLKYLNPNAKVLIYKTCRAWKTDPRDPVYGNGPVGYHQIVDSGKADAWLYQNGPTPRSYTNDPEYPYSYFTRISDKGYQALWLANLMQRLPLSGYDGVFIDDGEEVFESKSGSRLERPRIAEWEAQSFYHAVVLKLKAAGFYVMKNGCNHFLESGQGQIYMDPFWTPDRAHPASEGYAPNTLANTPDSTLNEYSFLWASKSGNRYPEDYWKRCLADMDAVAKWDTATGSRSIPMRAKKLLCMHVLGTDRVGDPAYGRDGWLQFGLASYMLGENDWTAFGWGLVSDFFARMDLSITKKLGDPDGKRYMVDQDAVFCCRRYKATADGGVGGVVVVNAHESSSTVYRVDFNAQDEAGNRVPAGTSITLKPHTGRILLKSV